MGGLSSYTYLRDCILIASQVDPLNDWEQPIHSHGCRVRQPNGVHSIDASTFCSIMAKLQPSIVCSPADICNPNASQKRIQRSLASSLKYFKQVSSQLSDATVFAPLVGGSDPALRKACAVEMMEHSPAGYYISDLPRDSNRADRRKLLEASLAPLNSSSPVILYGNIDMNDTLDAVSCGVHMIFSTFLSEQSLKGKAICFTGPSKDISKWNMVDLHDQKHLERIGEPLAENCPCSTCTTHSVSYLSHLVRVKEMLGTTFLHT